MFIHEVNNNIRIYGTFFMSGYQDESKKQELYQEINIFGGLEPKQKTAENVWCTLLIQ